MAASELDNPRPTKRGVVGKRSGVEIEFSVESSGWRVSARVTPGPYALDLCARDHRLGSQEGHEDEHTFGDAAFDQAFVLTCAPLSFAETMFDAKIRRRLRYLEPRHVEIGGGTVCIRKRYSYFCAEPELIRAAIDIAVRLAHRVGGYLRKVHDDAIQEGHSASTPYRGSPDRRRFLMVLAQKQLPVLTYLDRREQALKRRQRRTRAAVGVLLLWSVLVFLANVITV